MAMISSATKCYYPGYETEAVSQRQFYPYSDNGGSIVAIGGDDFVIVGADTRLSTGFAIFTREQKKLFKLSDKTIFASAGCWCDSLTITRIVSARMQMYEQEHNKVMPTTAAAQMLSTLMYYKRFFPYYVSNMLVGLDSEGKGAVYSYDPIGHSERSAFRAIGSSGALLQPLLDNQIGRKNMLKAGDQEERLTLEKAIAIIKDVFISAAERDIYTGDSICLNIITKDGITEETFALRHD